MTGRDMGGLARRVGLVAALLVPIAAPAEAAAGKSEAAAQRKATIVIFDRSVADPAAEAQDQADAFDGQVDQVFHGAVRGYVGRFKSQDRAALRSRRGVVAVAADGPVHATETQTSAPRNLDRIDELKVSQLDGEYTYTLTGAGVTAYVIDTGIRATHQDFARPNGTSRASIGYDAIGGNGQDCNGHGTHVAGTLGGNTYGAAKGVDIVGVRVLDCGGSGLWSDVIEGINWVTNHAHKPAVANMSLGGGRNEAVDAAVRASISSGVSYAIAAGNDHTDACRRSPSRVKEAMITGAADTSDRRASFSNYGSCVDWFAPGTSVTSAGITSDTATSVKSGTSMAAPLSAGVAALYLETHLGASPSTVSSALAALTSKSVISSSKSTNNDMLFTNF